MRAALLIFSILVLLGVGWYINNYDVSLFRPKIAPFEDRASILIGKWKYKDTYKKEGFFGECVGEIVFSPHNVFSMNITAKHMNAPNGNEIIRQYGGEIKGLWLLNDTMLLLDHNFCTLTMSITDGASDTFDPCSYKDSLQFGNISDGQYHGLTVRFDKECLQFKGHNYSTNGDSEILFTKID